MSSTRSLRSQNKQNVDVVDKIIEKNQIEGINKQNTKKKEAKKTNKDSNKENAGENKPVSEQQPPPSPPKPKRLTRSSSTSKFEPSNQNQSKKSNQNSKDTSNSSNDFAVTSTTSTTIQNETNSRRTRSQSRKKTFENNTGPVKRPPRNVVAKKTEAQIETKNNEENCLTKNFAAINLNENNGKQTLKSTNESRKKLTSVPTIKLDSDKEESIKNDAPIEKKTGKLLEINEKDELLNVCCDNKTKYTKSTSTPSGMRRKPLKPPQDISFIGKPE